MAALLCFTVSFSQYYHKGDYVVTLNNDTVFGIKEKYQEDKVQDIVDIGYYIHEYNRKPAEIKK